jgi:dTDP-4-dehydrorhamnose 3,5-epimerase-like enzyme
MERPYSRILEGGIAVDDRGTVSFWNFMDFAKVKRFYVVENFSTETVRGWHGHMEEEKIVLAISGAALFAICPMEDGKAVVSDYEKYTLTGNILLWIPPGCAHGFRCLIPGTRLMFFSTATLEESKKDDYRFSIVNTDLWKVVHR